MYSVAVHEAGHAIARWYLDRTSYLGCGMPTLCHVAVSFNGEALATGWGPLRRLNGICAGDPCVMPYEKFHDVSHFEEGDRKELLRDLRRRAIADIVHVMAGPIAQVMHDAATHEGDEDWVLEPYSCAQVWRCTEEEKSWGTDAGPEGTDAWQVEQRILLLGRRWRLHLERAFTLADEIVRSHQDHIHTLAAALVERGMIDGEEVEAIFDAVPALPRDG